jgi:peptidylprolyl isomerase
MVDDGDFGHFLNLTFMAGVVARIFRRVAIFGWDWRRICGITGSWLERTLFRRSGIMAETNVVTMESGVKYEDHVVGTGEFPAKGQMVTVHYTGWLDVAGVKGQKFDSSRDRGSPFRFPLGMGRVISGWDQGVATMQAGGQRTLVIPPEHGYGQRGAGAVIPPGATLIFDVELISFE